MSIVKRDFETRGGVSAASELAGGGGLGPYQQFAGVGDEVADFERLYQKRNALIFEVMLNFGLGQAGKS